MRGQNVFRLAGLMGAALLRDMFSSVNNRVNGFEHVLRRRKGKNYPNHGTTTFSKRNGAQECARRIRQLQRRRTFHGVHLKTGAGALLIIRRPGQVTAQFDDLNHRHAYGWTTYAGSEFAVGYGRK